MLQQARLANKPSILTMQLKRDGQVLRIQGQEVFQAMWLRVCLV